MRLSTSYGPYLGSDDGGSLNPRPFAGLAVAAAVLILATLLLACGDDDASTDSSNAKLRVVATTVQIEALAREVGGDSIELHGIVPPGADPHEFEPTASDLVAIEDADVILRHGLELDDWLDGTLSAAKAAEVSVVTSGIDLRDGEGENKDPHVWHDPDNAKIMVQNIAAALVAADPQNRDTYEANSAAYQRTLDETKQQVQAIIDAIPAANRKLVTNHDAFGYFARAFGLEVVGAVIPSLSTEAEPSAQDTAALLDTIKAEHVKAIFAESSVNPSLARTLASDAGVQIVDDLYGDSLGEEGSGAETLDGMLLFNARKIAEALK
jgi:ABC-type Zn uptake system ZnuABC Zn-binding protein ZnuA